MSGHTKGPWERLEGVVEAGHPIYKEGRVVVRIVQKRAPGQTDFVKVALVDSGFANARLIAAAPDLLEALRQLLGNAELARFHLSATEDGMLIGSALFDTIQQARDIIARATEAQP